jgi:hypothetical protein
MFIWQEIHFLMQKYHGVWHGNLLCYSYILIKSLNKYLKNWTYQKTIKYWTIIFWNFMLEKRFWLQITVFRVDFLIFVFWKSFKSVIPTRMSKFSAPACDFDTHDTLILNLNYFWKNYFCKFKATAILKLSTSMD